MARYLESSGVTRCTRRGSAGFQAASKLDAGAAAAVLPEIADEPAGVEPADETEADEDVPGAESEIHEAAA